MIDLSARGPTTKPNRDSSYLTVSLSKSVTSLEIYHSKFLEICEGLQDYYHIYTDGSKMNRVTAAAAVGRDVSKSLRINSQAPSQRLHSIFLILSDVPNIRNLPFSQMHCQVFWLFITDVSRQVMCRNLLRIVASYTTLEKHYSSHTGIRGNEHADEAAKSALNLSMSAVKCPATDLYPDDANRKTDDSTRKMACEVVLL